MLKSKITKKNGEYRVKVWRGTTLLEEYFTNDSKDAEDTLRLLKARNSKCIFCDTDLINGMCITCGSRELSFLEEEFGVIKPKDFNTTLEYYLCEWFASDSKSAKDTLQFLKSGYTKCVFCESALRGKTCQTCGSREVSPFEKQFGFIKPPDFDIVLEDYLTEWFVLLEGNWISVLGCEAARHNNEGRKVTLGKPL